LVVPHPEPVDAIMGRIMRRELHDQARRVLHRADARLYRKYASATMVPEFQFIDNLTLVRNVTVGGDLVECGAWRGGMSAAMAEALPGRRSVLFDSFEGLPEFSVNDSDAVRREFDSGDRFAVAETIAEQSMDRSGGTADIRKGWFDDTVPQYAAERPTIAVLRLDGDLYESTMVCLTNLFPLVEPGGLVLIDDYGGQWDGCTRAVHDYLSREARTEGIRTTRCRVAHLWHV
jgi:O-methyltransferase